MRTMWSGVPVLLRSLTTTSAKAMNKNKQGSIFVPSGMDFDGVAAYVDGWQGREKGRRDGGLSVCAMVSDAGVHRFMEFDVGKNDPASKYYVREFETQILSMGSVGEFGGGGRAWGREGVYWGGGGGRRGGGGEVVMSLVERWGDWGALEGILASQRLAAVKEGVRVEMGTRNGVLPARYAVQDQVMVQV